MDYIALGKRIRAERKGRKHTQEELSEMVGISLSFLGHIERGSRKASIETLIRIANTLNVSTDYLLQDSLRSAQQTSTPYSFAEDDDDLGPRGLVMIGEPKTLIPMNGMDYFSSLPEEEDAGAEDFEGFEELEDLEESKDTALPLPFAPVDEVILMDIGGLFDFPDEKQS